MSKFYIIISRYESALPAFTTYGGFEMTKTTSRRAVHPGSLLCTYLPQVATQGGGTMAKRKHGLRVPIDSR